MSKEASGSLRSPGERRAARRPGALPPRPAKPKRTRVLFVRLTPDEHHDVVTRARECGLSASAYAEQRLQGRGPTPIPPLNEETYRELGRIGNNINQIARCLHQHTGDDPTVDELVAMIADLGVLLAEIRLVVIGAAEPEPWEART
jgi:hypothetical protein